MARLLGVILLPLLALVGAILLFKSDSSKFFALSLFEDAHENSMAERIGDRRLDLRLALDVRGELLLVNQHDHVVRRIRTVAR